MSEHQRTNPIPAPATIAGASLREQVEVTGIDLAGAFSALLGSLSARFSGPQALSDLLGINVVTASRLIRAVVLADPVAVVDQIPGTVPLRKVIEAAGAQGVPQDRQEAARVAVDNFEQLIRVNAGRRTSLKAMLTDWLPDGRREFEVRRRQAAYKAISELKGVSCDLDLAAVILAPSEKKGKLDLLSIQGSLGLDRIRPDSVVQFGTLRDRPRDEDEVAELGSLPSPRTLDDQAVWDGTASVRLDQFCTRAPAPLKTKRYGGELQYLLGDTGFGPESSVDFVIAEVNRHELALVPVDLGLANPYFYQIPGTPSRAMLFDLLIHKDVYADREAKLLVYDTTLRGPAQAGVPEREVDLQRICDEIEDLGSLPGLRRCAGFPRYLELLDYAFGKLGWASDEFRCYRFQMSYPLQGNQLCISLEPKRGGD
ncbi:MAG: hypothetical protein ACI8X5_000198 [Planctomycetota bacterium]|jgi:hypothetical protein